MASTYFSRSRSPVLSIRTQPEDEDNLRAAIEEANRTQHEILPRNPWQSSVTKRDNKGASRRTGRSTFAKDLPPSQLARSFAVNNTNNDTGEDDYDDEPFALPATFTALSDISGHKTSESKKPWRRFTKRYANLDGTKPFANDLTERRESGKEKLRNRSVKMFKKNDEAVPANDQEAREAQFTAWLAEKLEEQNILPDLTQSLQPKRKRAIRKSVYGSLSGTRSFFRGTSKSPYEHLCSLPTPDPTVPPHVWSFERKDLLRDYLNNASVVSPISQGENGYRLVDVTKGVEPVELSAGPLPVELEGNCTNSVAEIGPDMSRTSTPSNGELPPYIENKKFHTDVAKDNTVGEPPGRSSEDMADPINAKYTCASCKKKIREYEVWDFCVICDVRDGVICIDCGKQGPGCQHEIEQLLRKCAIGGTSTLPRQVRDHAAQSQQIHGEIMIDSTTSEMGDGASRTHTQHQHPNHLQNKQSYSIQTPAESTIDSRHQTAAEMRHIRSEFLREMNRFCVREQDLAHRERDLSLRAREIEIRDRQTTLREREVAMQQRSDQLLQSYQVLTSHQERIRESQLESLHTVAENSHQYSKQSINLCDQILEDKANELNINQRQQEVEVGSTTSEPNAQLSILATLNDGSCVRSHAGPKRKKDSNNASASSTPNAASSPDQSRKVPSRNNSDRGAEQEEDDDDDEGRRFPKKPKQEPSSPDGPQRLFACPYSKHDPLRFSSRNTEEKNYRGCVGHFLTDVSRLKQHLKRVHWQPETYCPRCYEEFDDSAKLTEHARARVACTTRECPFPEKMDRTKQEKIHVKRPRVPPEVVWYDIYKVLFPGSALPESPYVERDDPVVTPVSATPQHSVNNQAMQQLSESFARKLNQHAELQNSPLQPVIRQALAESFNELLSTFSLSPTASPGGAGPSIVVSPVSRSPSDLARTADSPPNVFARPPTLERRRSVTNIVSTPQQVPRLQQPRPPQKTVLQAPSKQLGRSSSSQHRQDSLSSTSLTEVVFDVPILPHVREDRGYDDDCQSFERGDDLQAMAFVDEPAPPAFRAKNKSVMSIDSGYGSGRSQQHPALEVSKLAVVDRNSGSPYSGDDAMREASTFKHREQPLYATQTSQDLAHPASHQDEYTNDHFKSYSSYLDPLVQADMLGGIYDIYGSFMEADIHSHDQHYG